MIKFVLSLTLFFGLSLSAQDTLRYDYCNCYDIVEKIAPVPDGSYARYCENRLIEKGVFVNGTKNGEWLSYNKSGVLIKKINYDNGILAGEFSYFHNNGKPKFSGSFSNGLKEGDWKFYNDAGKTQWSLTYSSGKPIGNAIVYDKKGKKIVQSYNYATHTYEIQTTGFTLFVDEPIVQDPTSAEWFILHIPQPTTRTEEMQLNQTNIESEIFSSSIEIPMEMFNTYVSINYNVALTFENFALKTVELKRESAKGEEYPMFAFAVQTNDPEKLTRTHFSDFSYFLLDSKIREAFSIFTPWQTANGTFNIAFLYVVNEIQED